MSADGTNTELWMLLKAKGEAASDLRLYIKLWLDDVQLILSKGSTAPLDFTLHDDDHSFRVAHRMVELVPAETMSSLSDYELALLLLSAYLHDIGMNPCWTRVAEIRDYLLSGELGSLDAIEAGV